MVYFENNCVLLEKYCQAIAESAAADLLAVYTGRLDVNKIRKLPVATYGGQHRICDIAAVSIKDMVHKDFAIVRPYSLGEPAKAILKALQEAFGEALVSWKSDTREVIVEAPDIDATKLRKARDEARSTANEYSLELLDIVTAARDELAGAIAGRRLDAAAAKACGNQIEEILRKYNAMIYGALQSYEDKVILC